jgi:hypothetical protein
MLFERGLVSQILKQLPQQASLGRKITFFPRGKDSSVNKPGTNISPHQSNTSNQIGQMLLGANEVYENHNTLSSTNNYISIYLTMN